MSDLDDLKTTRSQMIARLKEITLSPKASYSIDGQSVSWNEYHDMLLRSIKATDEIIAGSEDPAFEVTQGFT